LEKETGQHASTVKLKEELQALCEAIRKEKEDEISSLQLRLNAEVKMNEDLAANKAKLPEAPQGSHNTEGERRLGEVREELMLAKDQIRSYLILLGESEQQKNELEQQLRKFQEHNNSSKELTPQQPHHIDAKEEPAEEKNSRIEELEAQVCFNMLLLSALQ